MNAARFPEDGRGGLTEVSRTKPCPVCGKPDWCSRSADGGLVICMREAEGSKRVIKTGPPGWVHVFRVSAAAARSRPIPRSVPKRTADWGPAAARYQGELTGPRAEAWATGLGLPAELGSVALRQLGCGRMVDRWGESWATFPMHSGRLKAIGIRRRCLRDGKKLTIKGGQHGLFLDPSVRPAQTLYVVEGATDAGALLTALPGSAVIGRPSCSGGLDHLAELLRFRRFGRVEIIPDADRPGLMGAQRCAEELCREFSNIYLAPAPPTKDLRDLVRASGVRAASDWLMSLVNRSKPIRLHFAGKPR